MIDDDKLESFVRGMENGHAPTPRALARIVRGLMERLPPTDASGAHLARLVARWSAEADARASEAAAAHADLIAAHENLDRERQRSEGFLQNLDGANALIVDLKAQVDQMQITERGLAAELKVHKSQAVRYSNRCNAYEAAITEAREMLAQFGLSLKPLEDVAG